MVIKFVKSYLDWRKIDPDTSFGGEYQPFFWHICVISEHPRNVTFANHKNTPNQLSLILLGLKKKWSFLGRRVIVIVLASNGSPSIENHETCKEQNNVKLKQVFALFGCGLHQEPNDLLLQIIPSTLRVLYKHRVNKGEKSMRVHKSSVSCFCAECSPSVASPRNFTRVCISAAPQLPSQKLESTCSLYPLAPHIPI